MTSFLACVKIWDQRMTVYFFLCDHSTEGECLTRQLFGHHDPNYEWAAKIVPGDVLFLFNFESGDIWGPLRRPLLQTATQKKRGVAGS